MRTLGYQQGLAELWPRIICQEPPRSFPKPEISEPPQQEQREHWKSKMMVNLSVWALLLSQHNCSKRKTLLKYQPCGHHCCALEEQEMSSEGRALFLVCVTHLHRHLRAGSAERRGCKLQHNCKCLDYGWNFGDWETSSGMKQRTYQIFQLHLDVLLTLSREKKNVQFHSLVSLHLPNANCPSNIPVQFYGWHRFFFGPK